PLPSHADEWPTIDDLYVGDLFKYPLLRIRPTQAAAGFRSVGIKSAKLDDLGKSELKEFLQDDPIPVIAAPDGNFYQIDHHHLALAALDVGRKNGWYVLFKDYSKLADMDAFWSRMIERKYVRAKDHEGKAIRIPDSLPKTIREIRDDPYRSLAWFVRKNGGYRKIGRAHV